MAVRQVSATTCSQIYPDSWCGARFDTLNDIGHQSSVQDPQIYQDSHQVVNLIGFER